MSQSKIRVLLLFLGISTLMVQSLTPEQELFLKGYVESGKNPYQILGVLAMDTEREIHKAFCKKSMALHPDRNPENQEECTKLFQDINNANEILKNPEIRERFDAYQRRPVFVNRPQATTPLPLDDSLNWTGNPLDFFRELRERREQTYDSHIQSVARILNQLAEHLEWLKTLRDGSGFDTAETNELKCRYIQKQFDRYTAKQFDPIMIYHQYVKRNDQETYDKYAEAVTNLAPLIAVIPKIISSLGDVFSSVNDHASLVPQVQKLLGALPPISSLEKTFIDIEKAYQRIIDGLKNVIAIEHNRTVSLCAASRACE